MYFNIEFGTTIPFFTAKTMPEIKDVLGKFDSKLIRVAIAFGHIMPACSAAQNPHSIEKKMVVLGVSHMATIAFWALDGCGAMYFLASDFRRIAYLPAIPVFRSQVISPLYESHMDCWYKDPDAPETTR